MPSYLIQRIGGAIIVVLGVVSIVFLLIHLIPGDPVDVMLGEGATAADREALRRSLGLDLPVAAQFANYLHGLLQLDLGTSFHSQRPVTDLLLERVPATAQLAALSLLVAVALALPLGMLAAVRRDTPWDTGSMAFSMLGVSIPNFWLGPLLILVFALWLGWFPVSGRQATGAVVLPALTLGTGLAAILSRMVRSSLLEVLGEDYIRTARAKGLPPHRVLLGHGLRNALLPVITLLGLQPVSYTHLRAHETT